MIACPCCGTAIAEDNPVFAGLLCNALNGIGAQIVQTRAQIIELRSRVGGKQIGRKTPEVVRLRREANITLLASLENSLPVLEGTFAGMRFRARELEANIQAKAHRRLGGGA